MMQWTQAPGRSQAKWFRVLGSVSLVMVLGGCGEGSSIRLLSTRLQPDRLSAAGGPVTIEAVVAVREATIHKVEAQISGPGLDHPATVALSQISGDQKGGAFQGNYTVPGNVTADGKVQTYTVSVIVTPAPGAAPWTLPLGSLTVAAVYPPEEPGGPGTPPL